MVASWKSLLGEKTKGIHQRHHAQVLSSNQADFVPETIELVWLSTNNARNRCRRLLPRTLLERQTPALPSNGATESEGYWT